MIGKLRGIIDQIFEDHLILDVSGVGYMIYTTVSNLSRMPPKGEVMELYIETVLKEDSITLYGFRCYEEKMWFKLLLSVQGVGVKAGLHILSANSYKLMGEAIVNQELEVFTKAQGIGKKVATRIVNELKDKVKKLSFIDLSVEGQKVSEAYAVRETEDEYKIRQIAEDAVSALVSLGFGKFETEKVVNAILAEQSKITLEVLITKGLSTLAGTN